MLDPQIKTTWGEIYMALGWQVYETKHGKVASSYIPKQQKRNDSSY